MNQTAGKGNRSSGRKVEIFAFTATRFNYTGQYDFSMIYFMILLVLQTTQPQCLEHWSNDEHKKISKETVVHTMKQCSGIYLVGLRKETKAS